MSRSKAKGRINPRQVLTQVGLYLIQSHHPSKKLAQKNNTQSKTQGKASF